MQSSGIQDLHKREEDYIYNRTIIGGIDENRFIFGQSIRKKIYLSKPGKGSWIVLVLFAIASIGGSLYYRWKLNEDMIKQAEMNAVIENNRGSNLEFIKSKLLEIKFPDNIENDDFVKTLNDNSSTANSQSVQIILNEKNIDLLSKEVELLQIIISENIQE